MAENKEGCTCKECVFCGHWEERGYGYDNDDGFCCYECGGATRNCPICSKLIRPRNAIREAERHKDCIAKMQLSFLGNRFSNENVERQVW